MGTYPCSVEKVYALDALAGLYARAGKYGLALSSIELAIEEAQVCDPKLIPKLDYHKGFVVPDSG